MKLAEIHFDWQPVISGADARGEALLFPLRNQSTFTAAEGWSIEKLASGEFRLFRDGMPAPVVVGDGYTYVAVPGDKLTVDVGLAELDAIRDAVEEARPKPRARKAKP